jgi:hypothetical protein
MVAINDLKPGSRYTFYERISDAPNETPCRGTFLEIRHLHNNYSYIYINFDKRRGDKKILTIMQLDFIVRVETLDEIIQGKTKLNSDVISVIDEFY